MVNGNSCIRFFHSCGNCFLRRRLHWSNSDESGSRSFNGSREDLQYQPNILRPPSLEGIDTNCSNIEETTKSQEAKQNESTIVLQFSPSAPQVHREIKTSSLEESASPIPTRAIDSQSQHAGLPSTSPRKVRFASPDIALCSSSSFSDKTSDPLESSYDNNISESGETNETSESEAWVSCIVNPLLARACICSSTFATDHHLPIDSPVFSDGVVECGEDDNNDDYFVSSPSHESSFDDSKSSSSSLVLYSSLENTARQRQQVNSTHCEECHEELSVTSTMGHASDDDSLERLMENDGISKEFKEDLDIDTVEFFGDSNCNETVQQEHERGRRFEI